MRHALRLIENDGEDEISFMPAKIASDYRVIYEKEYRSDIEINDYWIPLAVVFKNAATQFSSISINPGVMGGAPCIAGTRIPVYMILSAVAHYGSLEGAIKSYPRITLQHAKEALEFAKTVVGCKIGQENSHFS